MHCVNYNQLTRQIIGLTCLILLLDTITVYAQEKFENLSYGFSIEKPQEWYEVKDNDMLDNLGRYKFNEQKLVEMLKQHKNSIVLVSYYKYDLQNHTGMTPTVNVMVRPNDASSDEAFLTQIIRSFEAFSKNFSDFKFTEQPHIATIDGIKSARFTATFTLTTAAGIKRKVRSTNMAIPRSPYFFQIGLIDSPQTGEDCSKLFERLEQSILITQRAHK
jgi:hypothetical protein